MRAIVAAVVLLLTVLAGCQNPLNGTALDPIKPKDLLGTGYAHWVIEVDAAAGEEPPQAVIDALQDRLEEVVHPAVQFRRDETLPSETKSWSTEEILAYGDAHLGQKTGGDTVVTHLVFASGRYEKERVLGVTIRNDFVAIFPKTLRGSCQLTTLPPCPYDYADVLLPVLVHEFGHVLGLVNHGTPMQRDHEARTCDASGSKVEDSGHSMNRASVMYCAVDTTDVLAAFLGGGIPTRFDADDKADLHGNGGR